MIDDVNSKSANLNKNLETFGYGHLPIKTIVHGNSSIFNDKS